MDGCEIIGIFYMYLLGGYHSNQACFAKFKKNMNDVISASNVHIKSHKVWLYMFLGTSISNMRLLYVAGCHGNHVLIKLHFSGNFIHIFSFFSVDCSRLH